MSEGIEPVAGRHNAVTEVATEHASRYLQQLCKHFSHKIPASFDETAGRITFQIGECRLRAEGGTLHMAADAPSEAELAQLKDVIDRHLVRFAFREELAIRWQPA
ncbi:DUF2218 domain-containing protein [Aureimonas psammosilenae]|uniref:DUF2218 domain-containing protein n=1 Tax=Aureimonas psammosilenae TaxID=2495496 RepID=UPI001260A5FC|nr:DUF2218 domain-containing protein [Aureimonas psammosilenae]